LRELLGLPKAIIHEHLRERRKAQMTGKFASHFDFAPGSRNEIFGCAGAVFLRRVADVLLGWLQFSLTCRLWFADRLCHPIFWGFWFEVCS
jgi:hypothetical protein